MDKTKIITLAVLVFAFGLSVGLIAGISRQKQTSQPAPVKSQAETTKACWEQAKKRLTDSGLIALSESSKQEIKSVFGTVESISGNSISLKIKPLDILADPDLDNRIIGFGNSTKIYQVEKVESASGTKVDDSNRKTVEQGGDLSKLDLKNIPKPNLPKFNYQNKEAKIEDIKAGDMISVLADSNIRDSKNIQAKVITLVPAAAQ
jgi:hypothetical protein